MLRAIIVDDEEISVKRLMRVLSESGEIEKCHTFLSPLEAYEFAKTNPINIAFLDISMSEINGMRLSSLFRDLDASIDIVFVTGYEHYAVRAFDMDALDYIMKPVTALRVSKTLDKIRKRHQHTATSPSMDFRHDQAQLIEPLTNREVEILYALSDGLSNKEVSVRFGITEATVKSHVFRLYGKLGVKRRSQAIAKARGLKLLE
jgi:DNA-binding NarL/FixJ family response regulator